MYDEFDCKIDKLILRCKTRDPFEIASHLDIHVFFEDLGNNYGYFNSYKRIKMIHINCNIPYHEQRFTCAHELKHALFDQNVNTPFLSDRTLISIDKIEMQANYFATKLLVENKNISDTKEKVLLHYGVPMEMERFIKYL